MIRTKIVSAAICVLACLVLASCGHGAPEKGNAMNPQNEAGPKTTSYEASKFFTPTTDIVKTDVKFTFQNLINMAANNPKFYKPGIFANRMELKLLKQLEFSAKGNMASTVPTYFGFDVYSGDDFESIVADESKYLKYLGYASVFDTANNLAYVASTDYVYCSKLTTSDQTLSWQLAVKNAKISDRTLGNQIIVHDSARVLLLDTKNVAVTGFYQAKEGLEILHVIPSSGKVWVFAKEYKMVGKVKQFLGEGLKSVYAIDPNAKENNVSRFSKPVNLAKALHDGVAFCIGTEFYVFEGDSLNVFDVAKIHEGVKIVDADSTFNSIEVDGFSFALSGKQHFLDVLNPGRKIELPKDFKILHSYTRSHDWDYCVTDKNGWSGFDVLTGETTWSITADDTESMIPYLSNENGVLAYGTGKDSDTYVVKVYTPKK